MNPLFMPPSLSRFRARRAGGLALFCAGVLRVRCGHVFQFFKRLSRALSVFSSSFAGFVKSSRPPNFRFASLLRLPTLGYTFVFPLNHCAIARVFAPAHLALRAAFGRQCWFALPRDVSPFGLLMQPTAQPPCCLVPSQRPLACVQVSGLPRSLPLISPFGLPSAGYPASPRWHVFAPG
jgi:hypothetical protein